MEKIMLDDMIKALKCVASQDTEGDCYKDHENFMHMEYDKYKRIVCGTGEDLRDYISGKEAVGCPYYQNTYGCCFEDGELHWLKDVAELLDELEKRMDEKYKGCLTRENVATTLKAPREKWFKDENGNGRYSLMAEAFDSSIISWQVWETIRKLTCVICDKQYVRQLANVENADEIAEKLCQFVYDLKMGFKNQEEET